MTRNVALVAVGVNKTTVLTELRGAALGAQLMAEWFLAQREFGVEVTVEVLVDEQPDGSTRPVLVRDVQKAVARSVDAGSYDLLALYLSGHGIVKNGMDEQVLLSEVYAAPQEAINVFATAQAARFCGLPHVVIISDACRNAIDPYSQLGEVTGVPVIRRKSVAGVKPTLVDLFYATEPSQTAKEFYGEGFFTKILCRTLREPPVAVCQERQGLVPNRVIDGFQLAEYLRDHVPLEAASAQPAFEQTPDAIILSRAPLFLGFAPPASLDAMTSDAINTPGRPTAGPFTSDLIGGFSIPRPGVASKAGDGIPDGGGLLGEVTFTGSVAGGLFGRGAGAGRGRSPALWRPAKGPWHVDEGRPAGETSPSSPPSPPSPPSLKSMALVSVIDALAQIVDPEGPAHETSLAQSGLRGRVDAYLQRREKASVAQNPSLRYYGLTVRGAEVTSIFEFDAGTLMVELDGVTIVPLPRVVGLAVTAYVAKGIMQDVVIEESRRPRAEGEPGRLRLARRRAIFASLAAAGKLQLVGNQPTDIVCKTVMHAGDVDPTLALYAAYGCALAGNDESLNTLLRHCNDVARRWPSRAGTMFDFLLLSKQYPNKKRKAAPFCPLLSLGWSILSGSVRPARLPPALSAVAPLRLNAEWTTFRADVFKRLESFSSKEQS